VTTLVQISDPHFGRERAPVVEALVQLVHQIAPDLVVLSGDITQRARSSEFAAAAAFVERLCAPRVLAIPGNHDISLFNPISRFAQPYAGFRRAFGDDLEPTFRAADCVVLGVKTTRRYRHVDGEVSDAQRERVAAELRRARPEQARIIVVHQPLAVPRHSEDKNVAHGHAAAIRAWADAGADMILGGHIHLPFVLPLHESTPDLPRRLWVVNAGTAVSSRIRQDAGNSVNVLRVESASGEPSCTLEQWSYFGPAAAFTRASSLALSLGARSVIR
jgi:3',5'-cyclic AMP phosphodiesterase CpdA